MAGSPKGFDSADLKDAKMLLVGWPKSEQGRPLWAKSVSSIVIPNVTGFGANHPHGRTREDRSADAQPDGVAVAAWRRSTSCWRISSVVVYQRRWGYSAYLT